jgi:ABC-type uncharacterized transport system auxiliary subunit
MAMRRLLLFAAAVAAALACGCVTIRVGPEQREGRVWTLGAAAAPEAAAADGGPSVLVRDLGSALLYESTQLVAVTDSGMVMLSDSDRWAALPAQMLSGIVAGELASRAGFGTVIRGSGPADLAVDGRLHELGARQVDGEWYAFLRADLMLVPACGGTALKTLSYSGSRPLETMEYGRLVNALDRLALEFAEQAAEELAAGGAGLR